MDNPDIVQALQGSFNGVEPELGIGPGDRVRSYDFAGNRDCYAEGVVESITEPIEGCPRYKLRVERRVMGKEPVSPHEDYVYPPVNGTPTLMGAVTNLVERVAASSVLQ